MRVFITLLIALMLSFPAVHAQAGEKKQVAPNSYKMTKDNYLERVQSNHHASFRSVLEWYYTLQEINRVSADGLVIPESLENADRVYETTKSIYEDIGIPGHWESINEMAKQYSGPKADIFKRSMARYDNPYHPRLNEYITMVNRNMNQTMTSLINNHQKITGEGN